MTLFLTIFFFFRTVESNENSDAAADAWPELNDGRLRASDAAIHQARCFSTLHSAFFFCARGLVVFVVLALAGLEDAADSGSVLAAGASSGVESSRVGAQLPLLSRHEQETRGSINVSTRPTREPQRTAQSKAAQRWPDPQQYNSNSANQAI